MLFSTIIYLCFSGFLYLFGEVAKSELTIKHNKRFWTPSILCIILTFTIFSGLRYYVGVDYSSYYKYYNQLLKGLPIDSIYSDFEPIFTHISSFLAYCNAGHIIYFSVWAFLQVSLFYYGIKDRKYIYPFVGLVLVLGPYFLSWSNGLRQVIVSCAFVVFSHYIVERKFLRYSIAIFICSFMHKSAIILLPLYFLPVKDYFKNRYICICLLLICAFLGQKAVLKDSLTLLEPLLANIGYSSYAENINVFIDSDATMAYGPRRIVLLITYILIIWFSPVLKEKYRDQYFLFTYNMFYVYICLFDLLSNVSNVFARPILYLNPFALIMTAYLLTYLRSQSGSKIIIFWIALIFSCSYLALDCIANINNPNEVSLYKSILFVN